jgi:hypothetical protein
VLTANSWQELLQLPAKKPARRQRKKGS